jgi:hypothetical protein
MRRGTVAVSAALSLVLALPAVAAESNQPPIDPAPTFEQIKADHLKKIEDVLNSLQKEKVCVQAANSQDELRACRLKHKAEMKEHRSEMRKRGSGSRGGPIPPPVQ